MTVLASAERIVGFVIQRSMVAHSRRIDPCGHRHPRFGFSVRPYRTMVVVAQCLGLRVSEILSLQWKDIHFDELTMQVTRAVVDGVVEDVKTEYWGDDLPLDPDLATVLHNWKQRCPKSEDGYFPARSPAGVITPVPSSRITSAPLDEVLVWGTSVGTRSGTHTDRGWIRWAHQSACSRNS